MRNQLIYSDPKFLFIAVTTFIVSFCSIIYELVFAQALSIVFGNTVLQYSLAIGIYLFFLGIGSFYVSKMYMRPGFNPYEFFIKIEVLITFAAILGLIFIFYLSSFPFEKYTFVLLQVLGFIPIAVVGFLSGAELPSLVYMQGESSFANVMGIDYFGSLFGTVVYALFMYPSLGILGTIVAIAFINMLVAFYFLFKFYAKHTPLIFIAFLFFVFIFSFYFFSKNKFDQFLEYLFLANTVESVYHEYGIKNVKVRVTDVLNTPYQTAIEYDIVFAYGTPYQNLDHCLNLDRELQACGNWTESYHHGLVDVPMSMFKKNEKLDILILGGGDFIAVNFLKKYDAQISSIDLVDLDKKFQNYATRKSKFLQKYNQGAQSYGKLRIHEQDALRYLRKNTKKYNLVLIDLPGAKSEKSLPLYSKEFFALIKRSLKRAGIAVRWFYPYDMYPTHAKVLNATLLAAGFKKRLDYTAYNKIGDVLQETEKFFVVGKDKQSLLRRINTSYNKYTASLAHKYNSTNWHDIKSYDKPNSVFNPNYGIIVTAPEQKKYVGI